MKVLFVCSGGMSSAIVVNALKKAAANEGIEMEVLAIGSVELDAELENDWDIVMIAPQIRHRYNDLLKITEEKGIPCGLIATKSYSPLGGKDILVQVKELLKY